MVNRQASSELARQQLSALMDGELDGAEQAQAVAAWRADPQARSDWHAYHLIGDVLRSDELAAPPARDEAFLQALRGRLADEPVPLAPMATALPAPAGRPAGRRAHWLVAPTAVAAGFVLVAGVLMVTRNQAPAESTLAKAPVDAAVVRASNTQIRDAGLDRYLSAHRQVSNGVAMVVPGAAVRNVDAVVLENK